MYLNHSSVVAKVRNVIDSHNIPNELVINWDQTRQRITRKLDHHEEKRDFTVGKKLAVKSISPVQTHNS